MAPGRAVEPFDEDYEPVEGEEIALREEDYEPELCGCDGPHCLRCGCCEHQACEGGCVWATPALCSRCV